MKKLILTILLFPCIAKAQIIPLKVCVPVIFWISDTSTYSTGSFKTSTTMLKRKGDIIYKNITDTLTGIITFEYLDANKLPLDKKYAVLRSIDIK